MAASGCMFFGTIHFAWIAYVAGCLDTGNRTRISTGLFMCRYVKSKTIFIFSSVLLHFGFSSTGYSFFVIWVDVLTGSSVAMQAKVNTPNCRDWWSCDSIGMSIHIVCVTVSSDDIQFW